MRNIRFRYVYKTPDGKLVTFWYSLQDIEECEVWNMLHMLDGDKYELLSVDQFTGLLDANGKEIYENDIVESARPAKDKYLISWDGEGTVFYARLQLFGSRFKISKITNSVVIGNVHENPELYWELTV